MRPNACPPPWQLSMHGRISMPLRHAHQAPSPTQQHMHDMPVTVCPTSPAQDKRGPHIHTRSRAGLLFQGICRERPNSVEVDRAGPGSTGGQGRRGKDPVT